MIYYEGSALKNPIAMKMMYFLRFSIMLDSKGGSNPLVGWVSLLANS